MIDGVTCPYCGFHMTFIDHEIYEIISYWGEDNVRDIQCSHCDEKFQVKEIVERSFEITKIGEENEQS